VTASTQRRTCSLTLARKEWSELSTGLLALPELSEACAEGVSTVRQALARTRCAPDELVTITRSPLEWSPFILGLSFHVLRRPDLIDSAQRLRDQMLMQARRVEGLPTATALSDLAVWSPRAARLTVVAPPLN
jgi:hypothetical protein